MDTIRELPPSRKVSPAKIDEETAASISFLQKFRSQESIDNPLSFESFFEQSGVLAPTRQGLIKDLIQTQLALWTFTFSIVYTYCWQKRVHPRSVVVALAAVNLALCLSGLLALLVLAAHLFNKDLYSSLYKNSSDSDEVDSLLKRRRAPSVSSYCSFHSRQSSGSNTPTLVYKPGQARFWQSKISTERTYFGNTVRC